MDDTTCFFLPQVLDRDHVTSRPGDSHDGPITGDNQLVLDLLRDDLLYNDLLGVQSGLDFFASTNCCAGIVLESAYGHEDHDGGHDDDDAIFRDPVDGVGAFAEATAAAKNPRHAFNFPLDNTSTIHGNNFFNFNNNNNNNNIIINTRPKLFSSSSSSSSSYSSSSSSSPPVELDLFGHPVGKLYRDFYSDAYCITTATTATSSNNNNNNNNSNGCFNNNSDWDNFILRKDFSINNNLTDNINNYSELLWPTNHLLLPPTHPASFPPPCDEHLQLQSTGCYDFDCCGSELADVGGVESHWGVTGTNPPQRDAHFPLDDERFFRSKNADDDNRKSGHVARKNVGRLPGEQKQRRSANARERDRTYSVNAAFNRLRSIIPTDPPHRKLSKIETIRLATCYMAHLMTLLRADSLDQPCVKVRGSLTRLLKSRKLANLDMEKDGEKLKRMLRGEMDEAADVGPTMICTFCLSASKSRIGA